MHVQRHLGIPLEKLLLLNHVLELGGLNAETLHSVFQFFKFNIDEVRNVLQALSRVCLVLVVWVFAIVKLVRQEIGSKSTWQLLGQ